MRISLPFSLIQQPVATNSGDFDLVIEEPKVFLLEGFDDVGTIGEGQSDRNESDDSEDDKDILVVWEDHVLVETGYELACSVLDEEPPEVEPLASLIPTPTSKKWPSWMVWEIRLTTHENDTSQLLKWALGQLEEFGKYLGASYTGV